MLTQQNFGICMFQFTFWFPTEYSVDKWNNQYMDVLWCSNTFCRLEYILLLFKYINAQKISSPLLTFGFILNKECKATRSTIISFHIRRMRLRNISQYLLALTLTTMTQSKIILIFVLVYVLC